MIADLLAVNALFRLRGAEGVPGLADKAQPARCGGMHHDLEAVHSRQKWSAIGVARRIVLPSRQASVMRQTKPRFRAGLADRSPAFGAPSIRDVGTAFGPVGWDVLPFQVEARTR